MISNRRPPDPDQFGEHQHDAFGEVLEDAPMIALELDTRGWVTRANKDVRSFFAIQELRLPASLAEVTLESRLVEIVTNGTPHSEAQLTHHRRVVEAHLVRGPHLGHQNLFVYDITDLRRLATVRQEFVSNLVHELKTPITSLRLSAESLLGDPPPKDRRRFAERIVRVSPVSLSTVLSTSRSLTTSISRRIAQS